MKKNILIMIILFIAMLYTPIISFAEEDDNEKKEIMITYIFLKETKTVTINSGETLDLWIPEPVDGASLAYWITNPGVPVAERNRVSNDTIFYEDTTLYAVLNNPDESVPPEKHPPVLSQEEAVNLYPPVPEKTTYSVRYDPCNGARIESHSVDKNTAIGLLPGNPFMTGYVFRGWYTEKEGGVKVTEDTIITSNVTFYAHWEKIKEGHYRITYDRNYESHEPYGYVEIYNRFTGMPELSREGYLFEGWYTESEGGTKIKEGMKVLHDITVYAHWSKVVVKKAAIRKITAKDKGIALKYKKEKAADGFEIQLATSKKFPEKSTINKSYKGNKKGVINVKGLKRKKNYFARIRAYKIDSTGAKIYGKWSKIGKVRV